MAIRSLALIRKKYCSLLVSVFLIAIYYIINTNSNTGTVTKNPAEAKKKTFFLASGNTMCTTNPGNITDEQDKYNDSPSHNPLAELSKIIDRYVINGSISSYLKTFLPILKAVCEKIVVNDTLIVALVDQGYHDMALNFIITSIKPHKLTNFLLLATSSYTCPLFLAKGVACLQFTEHNYSEFGTTYGSAGFRQKMNLRAQILLYMVSMNYSILLTDLDMVYLKNPLPYFQCAKCHLETMRDKDGPETTINAGFMFLRPGKLSEEYLALRLNITNNEPWVTDQTAFQTALMPMKRRGFAIGLLDKKQFQSGRFYFRNAKRYFPDSAPRCTKCVVIHMNWISTTRRKIYTFQEHLFWRVDKNKYYSSDGKYLAFDYPDWITAKDVDYTKALANAFTLGLLLDRTVILPRFPTGKECISTAELFSLEHFDNVFSGLYRENSFLKNSLVPEVVRNDWSEPILLVTEKKTIVNRTLDSNISIHYLSEVRTERDWLKVVSILKPYKIHHVLKFSGLYERHFHLQLKISSIIYTAILNIPHRTRSLDKKSKAKGLLTRRELEAMAVSIKSLSTD